MLKLNDVEAKDNGERFDDCKQHKLVSRTYEKKTRQLISENLKLVDAAVEVTDARIPISSRNPVIDEIIRKKPRVVILNKSDLADEKAVALWKSELKKTAHTPYRQTV